MASPFSEKIRIRLKAYDYRVLDQSTTEIVDTARRTGARLRAAQRRQPSCALARDERAQSLVKNGGLLAKPCQLARPLEQLIVNDHRRPHAYQYALIICI